VGRVVGGALSTAHHAAQTLHSQPLSQQQERVQPRLGHLAKKHRLKSQLSRFLFKVKKYLGTIHSVSGLQLPLVGEKKRKKKNSVKE
jgi:hypothetical protein